MEVHEPPSTYAEYCILNADTPRYEILEGVGYMTPSPGGRHQLVIGNLWHRMYQYAAAAGLGRVFVAPYDVVLSEKDVVQPDVFYISRERIAMVRERAVFGAPDLAVEILSPSSLKRDFCQKLALYEQYGIREYWIVDIANRSIDVWTGTGAAFGNRRLATGDVTVNSVVLTGFTVALADIFEGVDDIPLD